MAYPLDSTQVPRHGANLTLHLHRRAVFFFGALLLLSIPAFWPTYFFPPQKVEWRVHIHGFLMFGWMALLIAQATLIRGGNRILHRRLGRISYGLVPLIVMATVSLIHYRLTQKIDAELLYFLYVILALTGFFALSWALAMLNRHSPAIHARYMLCTAFALVDPIVGRIVFFFGGIEPPMMQVVTYSLADLGLAWLAYADWKSGSGIHVFRRMLGVFVIVQVPTFFFFRLPWWTQFAQGLAGLPLP